MFFTNNIKHLSLAFDKRVVLSNTLEHVPELMLSLSLLISLVVLSSTAPILELEPGKVQGFDYRTKNKETVEVFLNIPYASPPIGELRSFPQYTLCFTSYWRAKKPQPVAPWEDVRNGTVIGPECRQLETMEQTSEDCLTLNIIRPKRNASILFLLLQNQVTNLPILLWIHGGAYEVGSAKQFGYEGFVNMYATRGIIVISIQYRLGVYGFFSTGDQRIPGNLGLFDMAEALKFVHTNAKNFGGDASRITVWGHSAGSAATGQLILSPISRDYIAQSIEMSGSPYGSWAIGASVVLGCDANIKECMKQKTAKETDDAVKSIVGDLNIQLLEQDCVNKCSIYILWYDKERTQICEMGCSD
ncbi:unnamed protein product [Strongylus vulgaris]|uniref:Carboxylic ester hydrolase n=1 Tax=Strongylus vulgaris TaxID=40348 RepID=A0A3P7J567_STRVU|nr:unnamed protein product [Strongylus vulgaris]